MQSLEQKKDLYKRYGTTIPDREYEQVWNPISERYESYSIREIVDSVRARVLEMEKQKESIMRCRAYNLKWKAEKERQIEECRRYNLLVRDLNEQGIKVRIKIRGAGSKNGKSKGNINNE